MGADLRDSGNLFHSVGAANEKLQITEATNEITNIKRNIPKLPNPFTKLSSILNIKPNLEFYCLTYSSDKSSYAIKYKTIFQKLKSQEEL